MQAPWIWQIVGFVISSSRFQARSTSARNGRRLEGSSDRSASEPRSIPDENIGPSPRTHDHAHGVVRGRFPEGLAERQHHLAVHGVALLERGHHHVADGPAILDLN